MKRSLLVLLAFAALNGNYLKAQEIQAEEEIKEVDSLYREDQFYLGLTFHLLGDLPADVSQSGFSGGLHLGFIRDFPINKKRNIAIGVGAGWSVNTFGQELFIGNGENGKSVFSSLNGLNYNTNRFSTQLIEAPIEFRWRTSTATSYKFWRVYAGFRLGYMYYSKSTYRDTDSRITVTNIPELDKFRLGTTLTFGYNTFNFHVYYSLNPMFNNAKLEEEPINMSVFKVGLMFYIL